MKWLPHMFITLIALGVLQSFYYYPQMPEILASHFDGSGEPNGWSTKTEFFALYLMLLLMTAIIFIFVPRWAEQRANFGVKLPHREYWLAPERIVQTRLFFRQQMLVMGMVHVVLAIDLVQMVIQANFVPQPRLDENIFWTLVVYLVVIIVWLIHFFLKFRKPG
ncbi:MAG: DUF1648 domain-containing protein [Gammaproteobacteria bacterium]|nr:DUF1648 domain-containing protein [Gammaproteobacteria bacterium]